MSRAEGPNRMIRSTKEKMTWQKNEKERGHMWEKMLKNSLSKESFK
jgi:hypothetical protein